MPPPPTKGGGVGGGGYAPNGSLNIDNTFGMSISHFFLSPQIWFTRLPTLDLCP